MTQYDFSARIHELYALLQDQVSRDVFWARMKFEAEANFDSMLGLLNASGLLSEQMIEKRSHWRESLADLAAQGKKIVIYGAGDCGGSYALMLDRAKAPFDAFCDIRKHGGSFFGRPIISPDELTSHATDYYVMVPTMNYYGEIMSYLKRRGFPEEHMLEYLGATGGMRNDVFPPQYFEFTNMFYGGAAFVDAGCYDGADTIRFADWCAGAYSRVFALEPDSANYERCLSSFEKMGIRDVTLIRAGLSDRVGEAAFVEDKSAGSFLIREDHVENYMNRSASSVTVKTVTVDSMEIDRVGMIKMDIEGAEYDALMGARETILRDHPYLAICVYHRHGDMLAIMDLLHTMAPEYRFRLRHYSSNYSETVLYAFV